jgi:hypothetical protein
MGGIQEGGERVGKEGKGKERGRERGRGTEKGEIGGREVGSARVTSLWANSNKLSKHPANP